MNNGKQLENQNDSDLNNNDNQNINQILSKLSNDYSYQKYFIKLLNQTIKGSISGNKEDISTLDNINKMLPSLIRELGIPFCDLINNNQEVLNYYCDEYLKNNKNTEKAKEIIFNFINVFNFQSIDVNPSDDLIEKLYEHDPITFKEIQNNKRINIKEIEKLYDGLSDLISTWRISINIEYNLENEFLQQFQSLLKEKVDKLNEMEKENKYPKATIEFFREKIKNYELSFNNMNINKNKSNTFEKQLDNKLLTPENNNKNNVFIYNTNPINNNINFNHQLNKINITQFNISDDNINNNSNNDFNIEGTLKKLREIPLKNRTSFYKDEILAEGEDEYTEFKNYIFPLNEKQGEELKRQFCGFLNGNGGRLYMGINDNKIVKGVVLNYKRCDALRNILINYTYDFYPKCRLDKIKVYFIPIKNMKDNKFINNLYIIKIIVLKGEPYILYSMTNKGFNSAIRLQGQCANLTAEEIYKEILKRGALDKKVENNNIINNEFKDPEPEINYEIKNDIDENDWIINDKKKNKKTEILEAPKNKKHKLNKRDVYVVEVKNIDINLDTKNVYQAFNGCGSFYQKFFSKGGKSRGYGILKFSSEHLAKSAIDKYNQSQLGSNNIILILKKKDD